VADSPFLQSVERRRPGSSMRNYVARTLPPSSAIVVSNRAPHEPRPDGGFARGAGGVVTALLTLAEVTAADWVACARSEAERALEKVATPCRPAGFGGLGRHGRPALAVVGRHFCSFR